MQGWVDRMIADQRGERMAGSPQLTLGSLIGQLETLPLTYEGQSKTEQKYVWFDFGRTYPQQLTSWRGSYAELAITFDVGSGEYMTAARLLEMLLGAVGSTFAGYKGGDFTMSRDTPIWVAQYGESGNTGVVGVRDLSYEIVLDTAWCEF